MYVENNTSLLSNFLNWVKLELRGWSKFDVYWFSFSTVVLLSLSISWGDNLLGMITAVAGIWCVILMGLGKRSTFVFGLINIFCYAYISYGAKYYGEVMLNLMFFAPMNVIGWFVWKKHLNAQNGKVVKKELSLRNKIIIYSTTLAMIGLYGMFLKLLNGNLPYVDSATTVMSIAAQALSIYRLTEQWILWIVIDVLSIFMWAVNFYNGEDNISILIMWSIYLVNAIIMLFKWRNECRQNTMINDLKIETAQ